MKPIRSIDEVIEALEDIIQKAGEGNSSLAYFAVLYQKVTIKVKEGIQGSFFDDGPRMEQLDIVFARRYLDAYYAYEKNSVENTIDGPGNSEVEATITDSWKEAFDLSRDTKLTVLQLLLLGINVHINLDLGIAAAEISKGRNIEDLHDDFNRINEVLSSLVNEVQDNLSNIWPPLKFILKKTGRLDDLIVDFSMEIARDGAWKFAQSMAAQPEEEWPEMIRLRDQKVARKADIIINPGWVSRLILWIIRLGERGSVREKINALRQAEKRKRAVSSN